MQIFTHTHTDMIEIKGVLERKNSICDDSMRACEMSKWILKLYKNNFIEIA